MLSDVPIKTTEVFYEVNGDRLKSIVSVYKDGIISIEQDGSSIYVYPAEVSAIIDLVGRNAQQKVRANIFSERSADTQLQRSMQFSIRRGL
jgi:hypothetical protein